MRTHRLRLLLIAAVALGLAVAAGPATRASAAVATVWAVGDGADSGTADDAVAAMIASRNPDAFLYLGDVYENGTASEFTFNYGPGYGRLKPGTRPTPGNHEWVNRNSGYDPYWGPSYSSPHYYSFDLGGWHLISANSEEPHGQGSAQLNWIRSDLSARAGTCTIAYWHRPRYSAGSGHGDDSSMDPLWRALAGHVSIVLAGHDHNYQRLKPIDGIASWVVGTGGHGHYGIDSSDSRLAAWNTTDYGALRLALSSGRADYAFLNSVGAVLDHGSVTCDPSGQPGPDATAPVIARLTFIRKRLRHGRRSRRRGVLRFTLSERARVEFTIKRVSKGRRVEGVCRRGSRANRRRPRCNIYRTLGGLAQTGRQGRNKKRFSGKLAGRPLRSGRYKVVLEATDDAGNRSRRRGVSITVGRRAPARSSRWGKVSAAGRRLPRSDRRGSAAFRA